ncbi:MAG: hypothetical protein ACI96M_002206, partial [Candidatus Azotimanducaceae bacterium]
RFFPDFSRRPEHYELYQSLMKSASRRLRSFSSESSNEIKPLSSIPLMSDNANLLDIAGIGKQRRL